MSLQLKKSRALMALSLTPLIDVVFLLLIFFLVATRFAEEEREMNIVLPEASEAVPMIVQPKHLIVNVDAEGQVSMSGESLDLLQLEQTLLSAWNQNPQSQEVIIRGDKRTSWQSMADVMNVCNKANIRDYKTAIAE